MATTGIFPADANTGMFPVAAPEQPAGIFPTAPIVPASPFAATTGFGLGMPNLDLEESVIRYNTTPLAAAMRAEQLKMLQAAGLPPDADPSEMINSSTQRADTEAAIAKIATANPELAAELANRLAGGTEDKSLWEHVKDVGGDIMSPVLSIGAKALDILVRPSQIIPELIVDPEDDPWYEDIGQALSGNSKAHGADVMEKWGFEKGWQAGTFGFVFDVVADPLSWLTFGLAGVGRTAATTAAGKLVGTRLFAEQAATKGLTFGNRALDDVGREVMTHFMEAGAVHADAAQALAARGLSGIPDDVLRSTFEGADQIMKAVSRTGVRKMPPVITIGGQKMETAKFLGWLEDARRSGNFQRGASWYQAKAAAGAARGVRFRAAVPFTDLRYISPDLTGGLINFGFSPASNFFRGMTGLNRLQKLAANLPAADSAEAINAFMNKGWKGVYDVNPALAQRLSGGALHGGHALYELSHRVGKITSGMTPRSAALRIGGLSAHAAIASGAKSRALQASFVEEAWTIRGDDGVSVLADQDTFLGHVRSLGKSDEDKKRYIEWLDTVPSTEVANDPTAWRESKILERFGGEATPEQVAQVDEEIARFQAVNRSVTPEERVALDLMRRGMHQIRVSGDKAGVTALDSSMNYDGALALTSKDADEWQSFALEELRGRDFYMTLDDGATATAQNIKNHGAKLGFGYGRGFRFHSYREPTKVVQGSEGFNDLDVDALISKARNNGGFTVDPKTGADASGGWAVARPTNEGHELRLSLDDPDLKRKVKEWQQARAGTLAQKQSFVGGWIDEQNRLVLDVTNVVTDADEALLAGVAGRQDAVFNLDTFDEVATKGREVRVRLQKPLVADVRPGVVSSERDKLDAMYADIRQGIDQRRDEFVRGEPGLADDELWDEFVSGKADEAVTEALMKEGYDGILYRHEDGTLEGTVFAPKGQKALNVKRVDDSAPQLFPDRGYFPRIMSDEYHEARYGTTKSEAFYGTGELAHEKHRALRGTFVEDETTLAEQYGITKAFIDDPAEVYARYVERFSRAAAQEQLGASGVRLAELGARYGIGDATLTNILETKPTAKHMNLVRRLSVAQRRAQVRQSKATIRAVEHMERMGARQAAEKATFEEAMFGESTSFLAAAERRLERTALKEGKALGGQRKALMVKKLAIQRRLAKGKGTDVLSQQLETIERQLRTLEAVTDQVPIETQRMDAARQIFAERAEKAAAKRATRSAKDEAIMNRHRRAIEAAHAEVNRIRTRLQTESAKALPAIVPAEGAKRGYETLTSIPGLENVAMHPYMAAEFKSALKGPNITPFRKAWREWVQGPWKRWATVYYPGFHARNNMGAWFNNWLGGVGSEDYMDSYRISKALRGGSKWSNGGPQARIPLAKQKAWGLDLPQYEHINTYEDLGHFIHELGIRGTNSIGFADVRPRTQDLLKMAKGKTETVYGDVAAKPFRYYADKMRGATEITENFHRQAAFLKGMQVTGGSAHGARAFTMMRHGDYEDLNDFEHFIKDLVPFYKWTRMNVPFQIHNLLENPAKSLIPGKASNNAYVAMGYDPEDMKGKQPEYIREALTIPFPKGSKPDEMMNYVALDLPMADLFHGFNDYIGMMVPMAMPFIENTVGKDFFTRRDLTGKQVKLAGWLDAISVVPGFRQLMDPFVTEDADGNLTIDEKTQNLLSAVPVFSRFQNWVYAEDSNVRGRVRAMTSAIFGVPYRQQGEAELLAHEMDFYFNEVVPYVDELRELGVKLPEPTDISPTVYSYLGFDKPKEGE